MEGCLRTNRLLIRRFRAGDLADLQKLLSNEDVMRWLEKPYTPEEAERFLNEAGLKEPPLILAVEDSRCRFIGYVIYHPYDETSDEIGWVLEKVAWNRGYAQELTEALIRDAAKERKDVVMECVPQQTATRRIALKHHFDFVGHVDQLDVYRRSFALQIAPKEEMR